jgi:hypothetical protein
MKLPIPQFLQQFLDQIRQRISVLYGTMAANDVEHLTRMQMADLQRARYERANEEEMLGNVDLAEQLRAEARDLPGRPAHLAMSVIREVMDDENPLMLGDSNGDSETAGRLPAPERHQRRRRGRQRPAEQPEGQ